jgi:hypothetical protein
MLLIGHLCRSEQSRGGSCRPEAVRRYTARGTLRESNASRGRSEAAEAPSAPEDNASQNLLLSFVETAAAAALNRIEPEKHDCC